MSDFERFFRRVFLVSGRNLKRLGGGGRTSSSLFVSCFQEAGRFGEEVWQ